MVESRDPVPEDPSHAFVLWNSCSHDVDMLQWLLPGHTSLTFERGATGANSAISLSGHAVMPGGQRVRVMIRYSKCSPTYVQHVTVDGRVFGYDWDPELDAISPAERGNCCAVFKDAYIAQWRCFVALCQRASGSASAAAAVAESEDLLASYARTFQYVEGASKVLRLATPAAAATGARM